MDSDILPGLIGRISTAADGNGIARRISDIDDVALLEIAVNGCHADEQQRCGLFAL